MEARGSFRSSGGSFKSGGGSFRGGRGGSFMGSRGGSFMGGSGGSFRGGDSGDSFRGRAGSRSPGVEILQPGDLGYDEEAELAQAIMESSLSVTENGGQRGGHRRTDSLAAAAGGFQVFGEGVVIGGNRDGGGCVLGMLWAGKMDVFHSRACGGSVVQGVKVPGSVYLPE